MQSYFITANDTDVGKTYLAGMLARYFSQQGKSVQMVKAIDCGGSGDAEWVASFTNHPQVSTHTLFRYPEPLAPLASPNCQRGTLEFNELIQSLEKLPRCDVRLIEGAGGIAVPIDARGLDWRDFAEALSPDLIIAVIDNRLGAINQSRLLHAYLGDLPHAFVLNEIVPTDEAVKASNLEACRQLRFNLLASLSPEADDFNSLNESLLQASATQPQLSTDSLQQRLERRKNNHAFRQLAVPNFGHNTLNLSDNDYLNLRCAPDIATAAKSAIDTYGTSSSASPLVTGYSSAHAELEQVVSKWHGGAPTLIWNSGYAANQSVLKLFAQPQDIIIADRLIHNSLISGILASSARLVRFPHNDLRHLETLLQKYSNRKVHVVTESVYSMDGDYPDLQFIAHLKSKYGFNWFLDEAHAVGWYGATGSGLAEAAGVVDKVDILTGTFGKALASSGAYTVFSNQWMRDLCINEAGEFIYSTYLPPASAAAAAAAIHTVQGMNAARSSAQIKARELREQLRRQGWDVLGIDSPIIPVVCGSSQRTLDMASNFLEAGLKVAAIRPPTVPQGAARLRLSLKTSLSDADYRRIINCFERSQNFNV